MDSPYPHFVVHIPHASTVMPERYRKTILLDDAALFCEMARMTDAYCDELFGCDDFPVRVVNPVSRLVCDVERFRDDAKEPCAKQGQGLMYVKTSTGRPMRNYDPVLREEILAEYYDPHHRTLTAAVERALAQTGRCTILDGHSFHPQFPIRWNCLFRRPDFDIGTDAFHTPGSLRDALVSEARGMGYYVRVNTPFSGAITPMAYYGKDKRVSSVMIEVNRRLYMNEKTMEKTAGFDETKRACEKLMRVAASWRP